jgi:hypothetical protein
VSAGNDGLAAAPALRIVRGAPTDDELAALVMVLASAAGGPQEQPPAAEASQWAAPARLMRPTVAPTGWWASSLPR